MISSAGHSGADIDMISATVHSCHADIVNKLNFRLLYPSLNQHGILPAASAVHFMRPLPPENTSTDIHTFIFWLHHCTSNQFTKFIDLLKLSVDEAGDAHEELATTLQEKLAEIRCWSGKYLV